MVLWHCTSLKVPSGLQDGIRTSEDAFLAVFRASCLSSKQRELTVVSENTTGDRFEVQGSRIKNQERFQNKNGYKLRKVTKHKKGGIVGTFNSRQNLTFPRPSTYRPLKYTDKSDGRRREFWISRFKVVFPTSWTNFGRHGGERNK